MAYRKVSDDSLTSIADAIRAKGGTAASLAFPEGFVSAIRAIEAGADDPFGSDAAFDYAVNPIDGAAYGFALNSAGFYESQNQKQTNSYAICRVNITAKRTCDIVFDVINYAEQNYDFGLFGNLDTSLSLSASGDTSGVYKRFNTEHSADVVQLTYSGVTAGSHFIDVKYIKDGSQDSNNDSLQFRVQHAGGLSQETIDKILAADPDLKAENIKAGVDIFGVIGTHGGGSDPVLQTKTATPSESSQTIAPDSGYDGLSSVTVSAIPASYVGSGVTRKYAAAYTPGTTDQTISAYQYLTGAQTIKGDANLTAGNIKSGVSIFGVAGTLASGGDFDLKAFLEKTITSLTLPDDLTKIGPYGLYRLEQLGSLVIPAGVTEVGAYAMYGCTALSTVTFRGMPTTLATSAFSTCNNLTEINVPWAEGAVANAPWGAARATIHYNS